MRKEEPNIFITEIVMKVSCCTPWLNNIIYRAQKARVYCVSLKPVASCKTFAKVRISRTRTKGTQRGHNLGLGARWRWVVNLVLRPVTSGEDPRYPLKGLLCGSLLVLHCTTLPTIITSLHFFYNPKFWKRNVIQNDCTYILTTRWYIL
jgi:hypothetical protein